MQEIKVKIPIHQIYLEGILEVPSDSRGIVLFVHGSGSSRFSVRNQQVANALNKEKIATLLFDLLTPSEEKIDQITAKYRFNIELLASRLIEVTHWCQEQALISKLPLGYFGSSTGGGAALMAAVDCQDKVKAIVSRGGRPDLAGSALASVKAPTLLIVGGLDIAVIDMNKDAMTQMQCITKLEIVPGATHLFEEPGTLDQVTLLAIHWFKKYLI